jgi:Ca2+:H+ antiporter
VPAVAAIAWWKRIQLYLGVSLGDAMLLGMSFLIALITYGTGRASVLSSVVHLILLATWLFLILRRDQQPRGWMVDQNCAFFENNDLI